MDPPEQVWLACKYMAITYKFSFFFPALYARDPACDAPHTKEVET